MTAELQHRPNEAACAAAGVAVTGLTVGYRGEVVQTDLGFALPPGESLAILGESGCGKTTLLTTLAGLLPPMAGTVEWADARGRALEHPRHGFVWQHLGLLPWKTVRENLALPFELAATRLRGDEARRRVDEMMAELGLEGLGERRPQSLSGGQRQRLAIGRALIARPSILFLDEPFSALDALRRETLQDFLAGMRRRRPVTTIFVTHDIPEAVFLASRILLLGAHPPRQLRFFENPAWSSEAKCADRSSAAFEATVREVHAALRAAASSADADDDPDFGGVR